jgi:hypothetical protein
MAIHDLKEQIARLPGRGGLSPRHDALLEEIASVEVIVADS